VVDIWLNEGFKVVTGELASEVVEIYSKSILKI